MQKIAFLAPLALVSGACVDAAPSAPSYREHVEPILRADCTHCHDGVGRGGAPPSFRLDVLEDTVDPVTGQFWRGARTMAPFIAERAGVQGGMPPGGPELNDRQRGILDNWGSAEELVLGDASKNHPPEISATLKQSGDTVTVAYRISDADRERVRGFVALDDATLVPLAGGLHAGQDELSFSTAGVAPGSYELKARLFDNYSGEDADGVGGPDGVVSASLGTVVVTHASTAPHVQLGAPAQDQLFSSADALDENCAGPQCIQVIITPCLDASGLGCSEAAPETYSVTVTAIRGSQMVPVTQASGLAAGTTYLEWDPLTQLGPGTGWRLHVEVSDGSAIGTADSLPFIVGGGSTTLTFAADIKPILDAECEPCHKSGGRHLTSFFTYDGSAEIVRGNAGPIYRRVVEWQLMPLISGRTLEGIPPMTAEQRRIIGEWLLAGGQ